MKANVKDALEKLAFAGDETESFIQLMSLPNEKFTQIYPQMKAELDKTFQSTNFQQEVLKNINTLPTDGIEEERKEIENLITEIKNDDTLSEEKVDILVSLIENSTLAVFDMIENPRVKIDVKIEKLNPDAIIPTYAHPSDAGADVYAVEDTTIQPHETVVVKTGIKVAIPAGYEIQIRPRSGLSLKTGLRIANTPGTIDSAYRGEVGVIMTNTSNEAITINKGDKIAQMVIAPVPMIKWVETTIDDTTDRGEGGFGSTDSTQG